MKKVLDDRGRCSPATRSPGNVRRVSTTSRGASRGAVQRERLGLRAAPARAAEGIGFLNAPRGVVGAGALLRRRRRVAADGGRATATSLDRDEPALGGRGAGRPQRRHRTPACATLDPRLDLTATSAAPAGREGQYRLHQGASRTSRSAPPSARWSGSVCRATWWRRGATLPRSWPHPSPRTAARATLDRTTSWRCEHEGRRRRSRAPPRPLREPRDGDPAGDAVPPGT